jgi:hypothetical protein
MGMVPAANKNQAVDKLVESVSAANGNMLVRAFSCLLAFVTACHWLT